VALLAPVLFAAHVLEEAPSFVAWFNSLVSPGISQPLFLTVNVVAGGITVVLTLAVLASPEPAPATLLLAWLALLMGANGIFHLVGTLVHGRYSPGVVTGVFLYLPYFGCYFWLVVRRLRVSIPAAATASLLGAIPMLVHGCLIVFKGGRLF
jgi:hypothetical protein